MGQQNTGHAKNVAMFKEVIIILTNMNGKWNPVNDKLKLPNLAGIHVACDTKLSVVNDAIAADKIKTAARASAYDPLNMLVRRVVAAMKSCEMDAAVIDRAKSVKDLIDGLNVNLMAAKRRREAVKRELLLVTEGGVVPEAPKTHSVSQQSFDEKLSNFKKLIALLDTAGNYATNQPDLSIVALNAFADTLSVANHETNDAYDLLDIQRRERNEMLYGDTNSIDSIVALIKNELESVESKQGTNYKKAIAYRFVKVND